MHVADTRLLQMLPDLGNFRSVLCLNGQLPSKELIQVFQLPVIATDGAAVTLQKMGIPPTIVVGDGDSLKKIPRSLWVQNRDQNFSDFEKAIQFLKAYRCFPAVVLGIGGGYIDHVFHNIELLSQTNCIGYDPPNLLLSVKGTRRFTLKANTKLSLFGAPMAKLTTHGLKWELNNYDLQFPIHSSCFNRTVGDELTVMVASGRALMIIYLEMIHDAGSL